MKKSIITIVLSILMISAYARPQRTSEITIRLHDNGVFNLKIDNKLYDQYSTVYTIPNLRPGEHYIEVTRFERIKRGTSFSFDHPRIVFSGSVNLPPRTRIVAEVTRGGRLNIIDRVALNNYHQNQGGYGNYNGYNNNHGHNNNYSGYQNSNNYYIPVMDERDFIALCATIENTSFDSDRLVIAKQALANNYVTSEQVLEILNLFSFESNKLDLAKFAYKSTIDKERYFIVNNAFSFSSSKRELNEYISGF